MTFNSYGYPLNSLMQKRKQNKTKEKKEKKIKEKQHKTKKTTTTTQKQTNQQQQQNTAKQQNNNKIKQKNETNRPPFPCRECTLLMKKYKKNMYIKENTVYWLCLFLSHQKIHGVAS